MALAGLLLENADLVCAGARGTTHLPAFMYILVCFPWMISWGLGCTLKNARLEKGSCEDTDSSPQRDRLQREVEVHRVMFPTSTCLQPHCLKCKRKLSSTHHIADLESITSDRDTTGQDIEGAGRLWLDSWMREACWCPVWEVLLSILGPPTHTPESRYQIRSLD